MSRLAWFNALPPEEAVAALMSACHSIRWASLVTDGRPYPDIESLQTAADSIWRGLGPTDWHEALDGHPRIGEKGGTSEEFSKQEQAGLAGATDSVQQAIADGNARYEKVFGHVFLISAAGRSPSEILANLESRLGNDPDTEIAVAADQHRRITRIRLDQLLA